MIDHLQCQQKYCGMIIESYQDDMFRYIVAKDISFDYDWHLF